MYDALSAKSWKEIQGADESPDSEEHLETRHLSKLSTRQEKVKEVAREFNAYKLLVLEITKTKWTGNGMLMLAMKKKMQTIMKKWGLYSLEKQLNHY
ncbi:hypothetical protein ElyMa_003203200 [Elysia marginata]|uniref:Uncharacterized protein n=1 Tax=Elysia marginata TaxID=1093978 RepID=A0AAV4J237_9GAST|nr:hypothetical protein ElyMa_003203200 [Elysia marginata]